MIIPPSTDLGGGGLPAAVELPAHIPGSGIEFAAVTGLRIVDPRAVGRLLPPGAQRAGIRPAAGERLRIVTGDFRRGDIVVTCAFAGRARLGRPMQVVVVGRGASIALDDPSLGRSRRLDPAVAAALRSGFCDGSVVWDVLAEWGICRCPRCHAPGLEIVYGMPSGPAGAGQTLGGCCLLPLSGDTQCARCAMTWDRHPSGRRPG